MPAKHSTATSGRGRNDAGRLQQPSSARRRAAGRGTATTPGIDAPGRVDEDEAHRAAYLLFQVEPDGPPGESKRSMRSSRHRRRPRRRTFRSRQCAGPAPGRREERQQARAIPARSPAVLPPEQQDDHRRKRAGDGLARAMPRGRGPGPSKRYQPTVPEAGKPSASGGRIAEIGKSGPRRKRRRGRSCAR